MREGDEKMKYWKLRGRIMEKFGSYKNFAAKINISTTMLSAKLNGRYGITRNDISEWSVLLDIKLDEIGGYFFANEVSE